ncbi:hypothetical protein O181_041525 [Austropuccinia psidii MF-1]|uniref:Uncharacterized protein n=1 Tax=Austropuccinia psidii MF-1 TaxID=1389203 RepID=A0A9Q3DF07_9BASI|nr:hypothetical protein [Austropuccinia psidii MF-1]
MNQCAGGRHLSLEPLHCSSLIHFGCSLPLSILESGEDKAGEGALYVCWSASTDMQTSSEPQFEIPSKALRWRHIQDGDLRCPYFLVLGRSGLSDGCWNGSKETAVAIESINRGLWLSED